MTKKYFLLSLDVLLEQLKQHGFIIGVDSYMHVLRIVEQTNIETDFEILPDLLAPVLAKNQEQIEAFYSIYKQTMGDFVQIQAHKQTQEEEKSTELLPDEKPRIKKAPYIIGGIIVFLLAAFLTGLLIKNHYHKIEENTNSNIEKTDSTQRISDSTQIVQTADTIAETEINKENLTNNITKKDTLVTESNNTNTIPQKNDLEAQKQIRKQLIEAQLTDLQDTVWHNQRLAEVKRLLNADLEREQQLQNLRYWLMLAVLLAFIFYRLFVWKRRQLVANRRYNRPPPYVWPIYIDEQKINYTENLIYTANKMRRSEESGKLRLNIAETLKQSIRNGGLLSPAYDEKKQAVEYLMLIDRDHEQNHRAQLFEHLFRLLQDYNVYVERFFYNSDPRLCRNYNFPEGISLVDLQRKYPQHTVLIFGDAQKLIDKRSGFLAQWAAIFGEWKTRVLFTPKASADWGLQEVVLQNIFETLLPANENGLLAYAEQATRNENFMSKLREWKYADNLRDNALEIDEQNLIPELKKHFTDNEIKWIASCAVYPELYWDLTVYLGHRISEKNQLEKPDTQTSLVTFEGLLRLSKLHWFRCGEMPLSVRMQLLQNNILNRNEQQFVHSCIVHILDKNVEQHFSGNSKQARENRESGAYPRLLMNLYAGKLLTDQTGKNRKSYLSKLKEAMEESDETDFVALEYMRRKASKLSFVLPPRFKKILYRKGNPLLGLRWRLQAAILLIALGTAWLVTSAPDPQQRIAVMAHGFAGRAHKVVPDTLNFSLQFANGKQQQAVFDTATAMRVLVLKNRQQLADSFTIQLNDTRYKLRENKRYSPNNSLLYVEIIPALTDTLHGKVLNTSGETIANARIKQMPFYDSTLTQANGQFALPLYNPLYDTIVEIQANAENYYGKTLKVNLRTADSLSIQLLAVSDNDSLNFANLMHEAQNLLLDAPQGLLPARNKATEALELDYDNALAQDLLNKIQLKADEILQPYKQQVNNYLAREDWKNIKSSAEQGLTIYPDSFLQNKLQLAEQKILEKPDNDAWQKAITDNTCNAYKKYKTDYPQGKYIQQANDSINELCKDKVDDELKQWSKHKKEYTETTTGMKYIAIQGGTFEMGSNEYDDEKPIHTVKLDNFYMSKYEVTNEQVCMFLNEMGNKEEGGTTWLEIESSYCKIEKKNDKFVPKAGYEKHPVVEFSWYGATAYAKWLSQKTGQTWRLPTEAEWEYAAKGGENYKYAGSDNIDEVAWYSGNSERKTHQVGTRKANGYGLYDMSGNVWEWCSDWYDKNYYQKLKDSEEYKNNGFVLNPVCTDKTSGKRVLRGGSWNDNTNSCRVAYRNWDIPNYRNDNYGFRVCSSAL